MSPNTLIMDRLGAQGDGVAFEAGRPVYVAGALPGETVEAEGTGERRDLVRLIAASPARVAPFCPYFGDCGGCAVQHLALEEYRAWKRGLVLETLGRAGLEAPLGELIDAHGEGRRRVTLHGARRGNEIAVGFMRARSHQLVPIDHCPILVPGLARAPEAARALMKLLPGAKPLSFLATASEAGLDIDVKGQGAVSEATRIALGALAERLDLARLSLHGELVVQRRAPLQRMGRALVSPPPGGFLQPTEAGERILAGLVREALPASRRALDLFAGSGPFTFALAEQAEVHAVEGEQKALVALTQAARAAQGLRRVTTEARDLFRRPLLTGELAAYDSAVLDPPRAGAEAQCAQLARSEIPAIVYVSCDAQSFARDAAQLVAGGHVLAGVTPVDQFRYSHHVELVAIFGKPKAARRR